MTVHRFPKWAPYAAFCLLVAVIAVFVVAIASPESETAAEPEAVATPAPIPAGADRPLPDASTPSGVILRTASYVQAGAPDTAAQYYAPRLLRAFRLALVDRALAGHNDQ